MVIVLGSAQVKPGHMGEALALSQSHVARSRLEPGCAEHGVYVDAADPNALKFVERWASMEALQTHFRVPASLAFVQQLTLLLAAKPSMALYAATELARP